MRSTVLVEKNNKEKGKQGETVCLVAGWILTAFLYQLKAKAIRRTKSPCCTLLVLTAEGEEEWRRRQAAVILIACLPPGYGSEIEPRKNVAAEIQCNFTVLILSGTERVKLLFFASRVWIGGKERSRKRRAAFYPWIPSQSALSKEMGKKPWLLSTLVEEMTHQCGLH